MAAEEVVAEDEAPLAVVAAGLEEALSRRASSHDGRVTCWKHKGKVVWNANDTYMTFALKGVRGIGQEEGGRVPEAGVTI